MYIGEKNISLNDQNFKDIFKKYFPLMCVFAGKLLSNSDLAKDLVQDVFIKVWDSDVKLENEKALQAYLYVSTKNTCFSHIRKSKKITKVNSDNLTIPSEESVLNQIVQQETYFLLKEAISNLGGQTQKIIKLALSGYSNKEVAEELQISINTVKTLKLRAYRMLRENLGYQFVTLLLTQFIDFIN